MVITRDVCIRTLVENKFITRRESVLSGFDIDAIQEEHRRRVEEEEKRGREQEQQIVQQLQQQHDKHHQPPKQPQLHQLQAQARTNTQDGILDLECDSDSPRASVLRIPFSNVSLAGDAVGAGHGDGHSYSFDDDDENHAVEDDEDDEDKDDGDTDTDTDDDDDDDEDDDDDDEDDDDDDDDTDTDDDYDDDEEDDDDEDDEVDEDDISEDLLNEVCEGLVLTDMDCAVSGGTPHATHDPASNVVTSSKTTRRSEAKSAKAKAEARAKAKGKARKKGKEKATKQVALSPAAIAAAASAAAAVSMSTSIASSAQLTRADRERREAERAERRKTTLTVQVAVLDVGDVFGDDCLRKHSENSYGVVALDDTEVLILNVKEVLENFKPRCNHWERLIALTSEFHQDDQTLLKQHEKSLRRRLAIKRIVSSSVSPIYARLANKERKRRREQHQNQELM